MPERLWVVNASPIISLAKISLVELLPEICSEMVIPLAVAQEIMSGPSSDPAVTWIQDDGEKWIKNIEEIDPTIAAWDLGIGETHVLSWAYHYRNYEVVIDDLAARKCAAYLGISMIGTISVVVIAKREGKISSVEMVLTQLRNVGFGYTTIFSLTLLKLLVNNHLSRYAERRTR